MKISVKTLNGELFQVEVDGSDQVVTMKQRIQDARSALPVDRQKLIHAGKVLRDDQSVGELGLSESDFVVCMVTKEITKKPTSDPKPLPAPAAPNTTQVATGSAASIAPIASNSSPSVNLAPAQSSSSSLVNAESLNALMNMGFPEKECRAALVAAGGNPDLAYEFLLTGIPDSSANPRVESRNENVMSIEQLRHHPQFNTLKRVVQQNPAALSQVLDLIGQQNPSLLSAIHANNDAFLAMMNEPIVESNVSPPTAHQGVPSNLDHSQMIQFLQALPPEQRATFAQSMGMTAEQLQSFVNLLSTMPPGDLQNMLHAHGNDGENDPPGVIRLTHEEMAAVNRLMSLGFSQQQAAQAYLACDKNEALAANLLLEGGWGDDENDFEDGHEDSYH